MDIPATSPPKGNILIVDDTPENLQVLSATLCDRGYKVRGVIKGQMAILAARSAPPDLIVLDIKLPDISGYEVCSQLKADPKTAAIPVIFISALDEVLDKVKAFAVGGADYITKPFQVEEVLARVEHQLTIRRLQKQLVERNEKLQQEILERRKAEEAAEAASQAKSQFLANMSHELRTPLNSILGFARVMMRDDFISNEQRENLEIINRSGEHLLELINDILDFSKIEACMIVVGEESFDLYRLLDTLEGMFQIKAEQKKLIFEIQVDPDLPAFIKTDESKLRSCLINLLGNAIKFTENGSVTLRVRWSRENQPFPDSLADCKLLEFEVEDTGVGIAAEDIDRIFDAFVQTEAGRKAAEGTGLGLSITRRFIQLMGGEISASSVLGKGSIFKFYVPVQEADAAEIMKTQSRRAIALEPDQKVCRILVVDDHQENRLLLVKLLAPMGFELREAENGLAAVELWESWQPDLILIDTRMPVMDGLQAIALVRAKEKSDTRAPDGKPQTVIIAVTASVFEERRGEVLAAGADDFIRKPFQEHLVFDKIAEHLGVRYIYEEVPPLTSAAAKRRSPIGVKADLFLLDLLAEMPSTWVQELYQAASEVNEEWASELVEQIFENSPELAEGLKDLVREFRLDVIMRLAKKTLENLPKPN